MNKLKQRSSIAGILAILSAVAGALAGSVDPAVAVTQIVNGLGLIAVDA